LSKAFSWFAKEFQIIYFVESGLFNGLAGEKIGNPSRQISLAAMGLRTVPKQHHTAEGAFRPDFVRDGGARLIEVGAISVPWQERRSFFVHARTLRNLRRLSVVDSAGRRGFNPNGGGVA
jgi:hypothetical protein